MLSLLKCLPAPPKIQAFSPQQEFLNNFREKDEIKVKAAVKKERQRLKLAKEELEKDLGKTFSVLTLKRFLKNLSADGNESG